MSPPRRVGAVILTGVAGSGKTTVGRALAAHLGWTFCDADDLHDAESIRRMRQNRPLDDRQRAPWLRRVRAVLEAAQRADRKVVVACSALKARYRRVLAAGLSDVRFVFLTADETVLRDRLARREGHFAGPELLESQLADLEPPRDALCVDAALPVDTIVELIAADVGVRAS